MSAIGANQLAGWRLAIWVDCAPPAEPEITAGRTLAIVLGELRADGIEVLATQLAIGPAFADPTGWADHSGYPREEVAAPPA
ncbi:MAG: hypothetical protein ACYDAQ_01865 [Mycobacteriales bacterium]